MNKILNNPAEKYTTTQENNKGVKFMAWWSSKDSGY
jgi:hypothetical protein